MAFQPFGYVFDIHSKMPPHMARRAIRRRWKSWFDPISGARGWIVGPFICLWLSAIDSYGPLLFGVISNDGFGTRISGRAGSDLNGLAASFLLVPIAVISALAAVRSGQATPLWAATMAGLLIFFLATAVWFGHVQRQEAEPLVRFLSDAIAPASHSARMRRVKVEPSPGIRFEVGGRKQKGPVSSAAIYDAVLEMEEGGSLVIGHDPEVYIQIASHDGGFVLEKRDGSSLKQFRAVRLGAPSTAKNDRYLFTFDEAVDVGLAYASKGPLPNVVRWEVMASSPPT
ncbi:MAG TPA: hypothetical protein VIO94_15475 [Phenylobacterium sp.]